MQERINVRIGAQWSFYGPIRIDGVTISSGTVTAFSAAVVTSPGTAIIAATAQADGGNANWAAYTIEAIFNEAATGAVTISKSAGYLDAWVEGTVTIDGVKQTFDFIPIRIYKAVTT